MKSRCSYWGGTHKCGRVRTLAPCVQMHLCLRTPLRMASTRPRGRPSHRLGAGLSPLCARETPVQLVTMRCGPQALRRSLWGRVQQVMLLKEVGLHTWGGTWSHGLLHMQQGKGLTPALAHMQPVCIRWFLWKTRKVRDLAGNQVITCPRACLPWKSQLSLLPHAAHPWPVH